MNPNPPTEQDANSFCAICERAYHSWVTYKIVFEDLLSLTDVDFSNIQIGSSLSIINNDLLDNVLLQIATLHDPAKSGKNENLTIDLFATHVKWSDEEKKEIQSLSEEMGKLYSEIKKYRNKILAHNARDAYSSGKSFGLFSEDGDDEEYFRLLGEFCTLVWKKFYPAVKATPHHMRIRVFEFSKEGITNDFNCPADCASALRDLLIGSIQQGHSGK